MLTILSKTWVLFLGFAIICLGHGLQGTLVGVRTVIENFSYMQTGIIITGYYIGYSAGSLIVPNLLKNYEFLWRLRNDFFRRSKRIIETFFYYLKGRYVNKAFHKTRFIEIE